MRVGGAQPGDDLELTIALRVLAQRLLFPGLAPAEAMPLQQVSEDVSE
jgi:hypothetical protein